jgi:hypothetical protein
MSSNTYYTIVISSPPKKKTRVADRMKKIRDERRRTRNMNRQLDLMRTISVPVGFDPYDGY